MGFYGDLASVQLSDILQSIEGSQRSGVLSIDDCGEQTSMLFAKGKLRAFARPARATLDQRILHLGLLSPRRLQNAKQKKKTSLAKALSAHRYLPQEEVRALLEQALCVDFTDYLPNAQGEFHFNEASAEHSDFDKSELEMQFSIAVSPLLLEGARRADDWARVRNYLPSAQSHLVVEADVIERLLSENPDSYDEKFTAMLRDLSPLLDGSRSLRQILELFPHEALLASQSLAELARLQLMQVMSPDSFLQQAKRLSTQEPQKALELLEDALSIAPQREDLLSQQLELYQSQGDLLKAAEIAKQLAHIASEKSDLNEAAQLLQRAMIWSPNDRGLWEKSFELAKQRQQKGQVLSLGLELLEHYRAPGMHQKSKTLLQNLLEWEPKSIQLQRELAISKIDCGEKALKATQSLLQLAQSSYKKSDFEEAKRVLEYILKIHPEHKVAAELVQRIDSGESKKKFEGRLKLHRNLTVAFCLFGVFTLLVMDTLARIDLAHAQAEISENELIESHEYDRAKAIYVDLREMYPYTPTAFLELDARISQLDKKANSPRTP